MTEQTNIAIVTEPSSRSTSSDHQIDTALLWLAAIGSTVAWLLLYRWYGLFENEHNTHFAFEKIPGYFDSPVMRQTLALFLLIGVLYGCAIWLMHRLPSFSLADKLAMIALVAAPAIVNIGLYPVGALDVFNYMIELKLTYHYDENPYLVTFEAFRKDSFALPAFLVDIRLFYGPAWLMFSWLPVSITGFNDVLTTLLGLKIFNLVLLFVGALLIARFQSDRRAAWIAGVLFLANPVVLFEGVANAHNDVMMTTFLIGALFALHKRSPLAGPLLALSALVKFNPLVLAPLMVAVMLRDKWEPRRLLATVGLTVVVVAAVSLPWWSGGEMIDGLTGGLEESQEMDHVSISSLTRQWFQDREAMAQPPSMTEMFRRMGSYDVVAESTKDRIDLTYAAVIVVLTGLIAFSVWKGAPMEVAAAATLIVLILFGTNFYAWYLIPVFALIALRVDRVSLAYVAVASIAALAYYPMYVYGHFTSGWYRFQVHQFLALFLTLPAICYLLGLLISSWSRRAQSSQTRVVQSDC